MFRVEISYVLELIFLIYMEAGFSHKTFITRYVCIFLCSFYYRLFLKIPFLHKIYN